MTDADEQALIERLRQRLDEQADGLDGAMLARLRAARARALEAGRRRRPARWALAGLAAAATLVGAVILWQGWMPMPATPEDWEVLAAGDDLELIEELEFYDWLDTTQSPAG